MRVDFFVHTKLNRQQFMMEERLLSIQKRSSLSEMVHNHNVRFPLVGKRSRPVFGAAKRSRRFRRDSFADVG
jgi:hypothetical protein